MPASIAGIFFTRQALILLYRGAGQTPASFLPESPVLPDPGHGPVIVGGASADYLSFAKSSFTFLSARRPLPKCFPVSV
jgi:hypothetical protein